MPTDKKISTTLTFLNNEDGALSIPLSYTSIDIFKPQDILLKRLKGEVVIICPFFGISRNATFGTHLGTYCTNKSSESIQERPESYSWP